MLRNDQNPHRLSSTGDARRFVGATAGRVDRLETTVEAIRHSLDIPGRRIAALQAEGEALGAKARGR
jgi:hypothetical protein